MVRISTVLLVILGLAATLLLWPESSVSDQNARGAASAEPLVPTTSWTYLLDQVADTPGQEATTDEEMFGFLFEVDAMGAPTLERSWKLPGQPPGFRPHPDLARIYKWELLDERGRVLSTGRHLDKLALYTSTENGACLKTTIGDHGMLIRCAFDAEAKSLRLSIEGSKTAQDEEHGH